MQNHIQPGNTLTFPAPANLASGAGFIVGSFFAVANTAALSGAEVEGDVVGVFELPAKSGDVFAVGDKAYWIAADGVVTTTATANKLIGAATTLVTGGVVGVRLNGVSLP